MESKQQYDAPSVGELMCLNEGYFLFSASPMPGGNEGIVEGEDD